MIVSPLPALVGWPRIGPTPSTSLGGSHSKSWPVGDHETMMSAKFDGLIDCIPLTSSSWLATNRPSALYSTVHRILQDTLRCLQLESRAQPQPYAHMHAIARLNQRTLISTFTIVLCPPLVLISITLCDAYKNYSVIPNYFIM